MCGIAGFVGSGTQADLVAMTRALAHRGPDGEAIYVDEPVFLGHRRLAVVDIAGGAQPMWNEDGTICVIYNGEIYNHRELRELLIERGHVFRSDHSDTEVLVHGYEEWGDELPLRLNGMFAYVIYDSARARLSLARDRFGEKPLFYARLPNLFMFASELASLRAHRCFDSSIDEKGLQKYFAYGFFPAPSTPFRSVRKLHAGGLLTFDLRSQAAQERRYWRFALSPDQSLQDRDEPRLVEELESLLDQAVKRRLMSDVPLGLFLSGGLDSGGVLTSMLRSVPARDIHSFTVGFREPSFDESVHARKLARHFGISHHEEMLDLPVVRDLLPSILTQFCEPLGDASMIPTYLLSRFSRRVVTVALSGDGGDELFAGYDPFRALYPAAMYQRLVPGFAHRLMAALAAKLPISSKNMSIDFKFRRGLRGMSHPPSMWNPIWLGPAEPIELRELFPSCETVADIYDEAIALWESGNSRDPVDRTLEFYTNFYLPDNILTKVDRATMIASLESRAVLLDNDLVAFCQRLPMRFKYRNGTGKYLLRKVLGSRLPDEVLRRPKKGFGIPLVSWLRQVPRVLPSSSVPGMDAKYVAKLWSEHRSGKADHRLILWSWLSLQAFLDPGSIMDDIGMPAAATVHA